MKRYRHSRNILSRQEGDTLVLFDTQRGLPFVLEGTAIEIWNILKDDKSISEIKDEILRTYEDTPETEKDIWDFISKCEKEGLLDVF